MSGIADVLRRETSQLLGFGTDTAALTPAQAVRVDRVASLRLEHNRLQEAQLRGEEVDMRQVVEISELLEEALRPPEEVSGPGGYDALRTKFLALVEGLISRRTYEAQRRVTELEGEVERLRGELEETRSAQRGGLRCACSARC